MKIEQKSEKFEPIHIIIETKEEAETIMTICSAIGGKPESVRRHPQKIYDALEDLGVIGNKDHEGSITFD